MPIGRKPRLWVSMIQSEGDSSKVNQIFKGSKFRCNRVLLILASLIDEIKNLSYLTSFTNNMTSPLPSQNKIELQIK